MIIGYVFLKRIYTERSNKLNKLSVNNISRDDIWIIKLKKVFKSDTIEMRDNYKVIYEGDGYSRIEAKDKSKKF